MKFRAFLKESHQPTVETRDERESRLRRGFRKIVRIDAAAFRDRFVQDEKTSLDCYPARLAAALSYASFTGYPQVVYDGNRVGVVDGRHRIAAAASRNQTIDVAVRPGTQLPSDILAK